MSPDAIVHLFAYAAITAAVISLVVAVVVLVRVLRVRAGGASPEGARDAD